VDKIQTINTSIVEISQTIDSTAKEITMLVHKLNHVNANGLDFLKEYTETAMKTLINKPVVCRYYENIDDLGGHEQVVDPKTGKIVELNTIAIGTITEVWIDKISEDDDTEALFAKATIWSYKYPKIFEVIERNFTDGICTSSVEVEISKYNDEASQEYRYPLNYVYLSNCLLGVSTPPADSDAGVLSVTDKEVAQAIKQDLEINKDMKGVENMTDTFNKGIEIRFHDGVEVNSLKLKDVGGQIYNILNPLNPTNNKRQYNYYIRDVYVDYVICESEYDYTELWKIPYSISNDQVVISSQDQWVKGQLGFIPEGVNLDQLQIQVTELNNKLEELKKEAELSMEKTVEELQAELSTKETEIAEFKTKLEELESKVTELNETIVSQESTKKELEGQVTELNSAIEELNKYKEQVETAEKEAKVAELSSRYEKLLSEETFKSERVQNAIQELNSTELNSVVVEEIAKEKTSVETASAKDETVTIVASKQEDLIPKNILQKYGIEA